MLNISDYIKIKISSDIYPLNNYSLLIYEYVSIGV
jgi:hypothetical protein